MLNIRTSNSYFPGEREYVATNSSAENQKVGRSAWKKHSTNTVLPSAGQKGLEIQGIIWLGKAL